MELGEGTVRRRGLVSLALLTRPDYLIKSVCPVWLCKEEASRWVCFLKKLIFLKVNLHAETGTDSMGAV